MPLLRLPCSHLGLLPPPPPLSSGLRRRLRPISCSFSSHFKPPRRELHARDLRIDFGRHNGQLLGTLPSSYLRWLSQNSHDPFLSHWSDLASLVLKDPVYQDRVEWEPAHRLFSGEGLKGNFVCDESFDVMKAYREIGERFGWDMEDEEGWARVNRDFIGTSYSGRIPRKSVKKKEEREGRENEGLDLVRERERKEVTLVRGKRGERIERRRLKREKDLEIGKIKEIGVEEEEEEEEEVEEEEEEEGEREKAEMGRRGRRERGFNKGMDKKSDEKLLFQFKRESKIGDGGSINPFPGRDALFEKMRRRKG